MSHKKSNKDWAKVKQAFDEVNATHTEDEMPSDDKQDDLSTAEVQGTLEHPDYKALERKLTEAEQEVTKYKEAAQRALAELENVRERARRETKEAGLFGAKNCVLAFLSVKDNLDLSMANLNALSESARKEQGLDGLIQGIELTAKSFDDVLQKQGVTIIHPKDEAFDPNKHEAVSVVEVEGVAPNTVINVFQTGYMLYERVIRPARVIVSK